MTNPPLTEIGFKLYGIKDGTETALILGGKLEASKNWQYTVPKSIDLTGYDSFRIEEVRTAEQNVLLYGYIVSDTYNVVGTSGEIKLTNKDSTPTEVNVTAEKCGEKVPKRFRLQWCCWHRTSRSPWKK